MATTAKIAKTNKKPKFSTQHRNRCSIADTGVVNSAYWNGINKWNQLSNVITNFYMNDPSDCSIGHGDGENEIGPGREPSGPRWQASIAAATAPRITSWDRPCDWSRTPTISCGHRTP